MPSFRAQYTCGKKMPNVRSQTNSQMEITQPVQIAAFTWRFSAKALCRLTLLEWYPLRTTLPTLHKHCTCTRSPTPRAHKERSECARTEKKEYVCSCGKDFSVSNFQETELLHLICYIRPQGGTYGPAGRLHRRWIKRNPLRRDWVCQRSEHSTARSVLRLRHGLRVQVTI